MRATAANPASRRSPVLRILALAFLAVMVHGYHLGTDDAGIFVPAIKRAADPGLYPFGGEFFLSHAHMSLFPALVGGSARWTHLPVNLVIFLWHAGGIFLLLLACWRLAGACFESDRARWGAVALVAGALSVPVAGTALVIMDPYLTARSLSTPATMFAIAAYVSGRPRHAAAWLLFTALIHPQMALYGAVFIACMALYLRLSSAAGTAPALALLPFAWDFQPARGAAREALISRTYFFVSNWAWYEWVGVFAPLALLWWLSGAAPRNTTPAFRRLARTLVPFGLLFTAAGAALAASPRLENFNRLQPMRAFHLLYVILFVLVGGLVAEYVLRAYPWRWAALFFPLAASMWLLQRADFPVSAHVEWPGRTDRNPWVAAFVWVRDHTPKDAVFALDPNYMAQAGEDQHGFRAIAERSALADNVKDSGAVSLFPQLADDWKSQVQAQSGWEHFRRADFEQLARSYPVTWILTRRPGPAGMACPYQNADLTVCRVDRPDSSSLRRP